uniref:Uncharacterized protein AlNc14C160G7747 n=1 Tax=Albugo laibachii Nc14 TaxID=890382 RepID=F0WMR1_9STRA|nr:sporangia induced hypothetical protein [Albugo laibachii Nc14]|eukprot:CCA22596.1 sporangia induced hypothetical protein [Albugo laibachii Nc14]
MADGSQAAHSKKAQDAVDHFAVIESYIESFHVQCFIVLLLLYDVSTAALEMYLQSYIRLSECGQLVAVNNLTAINLCTATSCPWTLWGINILLRLISFGSGFTQTLFLLEITLLLAIKKKSIQIPYAVDLMILILAMAYELYAQSGGGVVQCVRIRAHIVRVVFRLLGVFRIAWRVYAQMIKLLCLERAQHQETENALNEMTFKYVEMQLNANAMQTRLEKEYETREDWKGLIEGYKDEIETLRDALEIAAMAVAQAKQLPEEVNKPLDNLIESNLTKSQALQ